MENKSHALLAGCFTLFLIIATICGAIWFNRDRTERIPFVLATNQAISGLNPQAPVRYRGLMVGRVKNISFDSKNRGQILVEIHVDPDTPITRSTFASLGYQGVTGIAFVQLDDDGKQSELLKSSPEQLARIPLRPGLLGQLEQSAKQILRQSEELAARANMLLAVSNQQKIFDTVDNVNKAVVQWQSIPAQLQPTLEKLPALAQSAQMSLQSIDNLVQSLNKVANHVQGKDGTLLKINQGIEKFGSVAEELELATFPKLNALGDDARNSMQVINKSIQNISDRPQSLIFGATPLAPGPGETGFVAPVNQPSR